MNIIIVGYGRVGMTLTKELISEKHNVTIVDENAQRIQEAAAEYDVLGVIGNGASHSVLMDAGIENADILVAVTASDELNLLCCLMAKKAGNCSTIARVRNPVYSREADYIRRELGLSMIINPELEAASEIARLLQFPKAIEIDSFAKGRVELLKFRVDENSMLDGFALREIHSKLNSEVHVCAVERGSEVIIPDGRFVFQAKDKVSIVATPANASKLFKKIGFETHSVKDAILVGGGRIAIYLSMLLLEMGIQVKIIEQSRERCEELCVLLPKATIIHGDGTNKQLLIEEGLDRAGAFVTLTGMDEENVMLALFARGRSKAKLIIKVKHLTFREVLNELDLDTVIYPQDITAESILQYARAKKNAVAAILKHFIKLLMIGLKLLSSRLRKTVR